VIVALLAALLLFAATRPDRFSVERHIAIRAAAAKIQPWIAEFQRWADWSRWETLGPSKKRSFVGWPAGAGASYGWQGNRAVCSGRMEVTAVAPDKVSIQFDFIQPFEAHITTDFVLTPKDGGTEVRWLMRGPSPFVSRLMGVFVRLDSMIGKDFERGLAQLKVVSERQGG
jgi:hypothetical protein